MAHDALVELLAAGDHSRRQAGPHLSGEFLRDTIAFATRYARIEKMLFGGVRIAYSQEALQMDLAITGDLVQQGEDLAAAERRRFELPAGPILGVDRLVEDQGLKLLPRDFPAGLTARAGFFFDSDIGPCVFYDAKLSLAQRDYWVAHEYGHFLADYEPYIHTICTHPGPATFDDPREVRAHQFALAFSMPRADLEMYRSAAHIEPGPGIPREFIRQLQVYFAVDNEIVLWRLLSLGWTDPAGLQKLLTQDSGLLPEIDLEQVDGDPRLALSPTIPERYIHLVASAFGRGRIELDEAASLLETDLEEARHLLGQFHYGEPASGADKPGESSRPSLN